MWGGLPTGKLRGGGGCLSSVSHVSTIAKAPHTDSTSGTGYRIRLDKRHTSRFQFTKLEGHGRCEQGHHFLYFLCPETLHRVTGWFPRATGSYEVVYTQTVSLLSQRNCCWGGNHLVGRFLLVGEASFQKKKCLDTLRSIDEGTCEHCNC